MNKTLQRQYSDIYTYILKMLNEMKGNNLWSPILKKKPLSMCNGIACEIIRITECQILMWLDFLLSILKSHIPYSILDLLFSILKSHIPKMGCLFCSVLGLLFLRNGKINLFFLKNLIDVSATFCYNMTLMVALSMQE